MDVQVPVKSGKTVHVNKNYAIEVKSQNFAIKVKTPKLPRSCPKGRIDLQVPVKKGKNRTCVHNRCKKNKDARRKPPRTRGENRQTLKRFNKANRFWMQACIPNNGQCLPNQFLPIRTD